MLDTKLFEYARVCCANDYIMAKEEQDWEAAVKYINTNNLRIENLIFKPKTNQIRFMFLPCRANNNLTQVFNVTNPPTQFLRLFWDLNITEVQSAMTQYMLQSDLKKNYEKLEEDERLWVTAVILGSKESD